MKKFWIIGKLSHTGDSVTYLSVYNDYMSKVYTTPLSAELDARKFIKEVDKSAKIVVLEVIVGLYAKEPEIIPILVD